MTVSTDGKILIWEECLRYPVKGYSLQRKKEGVLSVIGTLSISQSLEDKNTFVLGTEAGSLYRAMLANENKKFVNQRWKPEAQQVISNLN
jgi:hypothetical protein